MAALNFAPHVIERVLNHVSGVQGGLVGVYQRHEYRAHRKAAMTAWGARVAVIVGEVGGDPMSWRPPPGAGHRIGGGRRR